ncbi:MAG: 4-hydroxy-3-methylbut-2-enyl diphosphate reductase [Desulfobulbaceae bacterium A2]|nr:MAG: 4-hydroxy-3-methylbut-2-enyl diphosphate reductase [Desulfobulbaceae bacterium A2]
MEILLANPRGFCAGVRRAIETVERALGRYGAPVHVLHEIVHNRHVLDELRQRGAVFVKNLDEVPVGRVIVFSAHGVSRAVEEEARRRGLIPVDATCPLVARVQRRVREMTREGREVLILGHAGHPEVEGVRGRAEGPVRVVSRREEIEALTVTDPGRLAFVTQTTLSTDDCATLITALRDRFPAIKAPGGSDICYATQNRQNAVREIAGQASLVLVVGSKNSSNSNRLREEAQRAGCMAYLIDDAGELEPAWFEGVARVGVTAGASAPERLVTEVVGWLCAHGDAQVVERKGREETVHFQPVELPTLGGAL